MRYSVSCRFSAALNETDGDPILPRGLPGPHVFQDVFHVYGVDLGLIGIGSCLYRVPGISPVSYLGWGGEVGVHE